MDAAISMPVASALMLMPSYTYFFGDGILSDCISSPCWLCPRLLLAPNPFFRTGLDFTGGHCGRKRQERLSTEEVNRTGKESVLHYEEKGGN